MVVTLPMNVGLHPQFFVMLRSTSQKKKKKKKCITDMWKRQVGEQGTRWTTMEKWFHSWQGQEIYLSCKTFRLVQPTIQRVKEVKQLVYA